MKSTVSFEASYLRDRFTYNPDTGVLLWKVKAVNSWRDTAWNTRYSGQEAGRVGSDGYRVIYLDGRAVKAHRVAWAIQTRVWPAATIDHMDGDKSNNKLSNLRLCSNKENSRNAKQYSSNKTGQMGVCWNKDRNKWVAYISKDFLGHFDDWESAVEARKSAEKDRGYHENHGRLV